MAHPINDVMNVTMDKVRTMMDANTVIGQPIEAGGVTVIPVCKISIGYASGGSDFAQKNQKADNPNAFGGGAGVGCTVTPISFLIISDGNARVVSVDQPPETAADKVMEIVPEVVDKISGMVKKKGEKSKDDKAKDDAKPAEENASEEVKEESKGLFRRKK